MTALWSLSILHFLSENHPSREQMDRLRRWDWIAWTRLLWPTVTRILSSSTQATGGLMKKHQGGKCGITHLAHSLHWNWEGRSKLWKFACSANILLELDVIYWSLIFTENITTKKATMCIQGCKSLKHTEMHLRLGPDGLKRTSIRSELRFSLEDTLSLTSGTSIETVIKFIFLEPYNLYQYKSQGIVLK